MELFMCNICIPHKQVLAKNFAGVESGFNTESEILVEPEGISCKCNNVHATMQ